MKSVEEEVEEKVPATFKAAIPEGKIFDATTAKGVENGLFQACMKAIRSAHFRSNRIRAFLVLSGLFTDIRIYRDFISIFYLLTAELEAKLEQLAEKERDKIAVAVWSLGYRFTSAYEEDLAFLYQNNHEWKETAQQTLRKNPAAVDYLQRLQTMTSSEELAGAAFVLIGALIIGGGAAAMPRVQSRYGEEATHLFRPVSGPGRQKRKRAFIACWDSLALPGTPEFDTVVESSRRCMQGNNDVLSTMARNPWWLWYVIVYGVGIIAVGVGWYLRQRSIL